MCNADIKWEFGAAAIILLFSDPMASSIAVDYHTSLTPVTLSQNVEVMKQIPFKQIQNGRTFSTVQS
eukprot:2773253-Amphidinium_carterae.1